MEEEISISIPLDEAEKLLRQLRIRPSTVEALPRTVSSLQSNIDEYRWVTVSPKQIPFGMKGRVRDFIVSDPATGLQLETPKEVWDEAVFVSSVDSEKKPYVILRKEFDDDEPLEAVELFQIPRGIELLPLPAPRFAKKRVTSRT